MTRFLLWLFFLADIAGVLWCGRVLTREARKHLSWYRGQHRYRAQAATLELHDDLVPVPARVEVPTPRTESTPLRLVG